MARRAQFAPSMTEKTEKPTPRRLREARDKGQVARSRTVGALAGLVGGALALSAGGAGAAASLLVYAREAVAAAFTGVDPGVALLRAAAALRDAALPPLAAAFGAALVGTAVQVGLAFRTAPLVPSIERVSPIAGAKRLFSAQALVEVAKAAATAALVLWVAYAGLRGAARALAATPRVNAVEAVRVALGVAGDVARRAILVGAAMAAIDYLWQRRQFFKGLRMTREEIRREYKESEGDPRVRGRRKQLYRELLAGTAHRGVQAATAVVVNPTHVAVAIRYEATDCPAPTITDKGVGERARRIRALAEDLRVPVVRDVPLARTLVQLDVGEEIPEELYRAVAVVLKTALEAAGPGPRPANPMRTP